MKIEIDTNKVVENAISRLVEEDVLKNIIEDSRIEDIVDDIFSKEDAKKQIGDKVAAIIDTYFSSDEGKEYVIDAIKSEIDNSDLLSDDKIVESVAEFLKKKLELT
jgi:hypothetical protein